MLPRRWLIHPRLPPEQGARFPDLPPLLVQLLYNRGLTEPLEIADFLRNCDGPLHDPFLLPDMDRAVGRIEAALRRGELVAVYGDYDADGVTGVALLCEALTALGARVLPYVPRRLIEGYGLHAPALAQLRRQGASLVISVDCGVSGAPEVEFAARLGLDVIVVDHHEVPESLPKAVAVIAPKRDDHRYPFLGLASVGVGFKLVQALYHRALGVEESRGRFETCPYGAPLGRASQIPSLGSFLDLVALGTVADVAPLLGENRTLVSRGLAVLNQGERLGVREMVQQARLKLGRLDARSIAYILGPRLNAAGRIDDASVSYRLLLTRSPAEARELAQLLEEANRRRQRLTQRALDRAREQAARQGGSAEVLIIAGPEFSAGIAGLVAARLVEEFYRPTVIVELKEGECRGSARSIAGFNITAALSQCRDLLRRFGGHAHAAGFALVGRDLAAFSERLRSIAAREMAGLDLRPPLKIDAELTPAAISLETHQLVAALAPFGEGNPTPLFFSRGLHAVEARRVGRGPPGHLRLRLSDGRQAWNAIGFGMGDRADSVPRPLDVVYSLEAETNPWDGALGLSLRLHDLRPG